MLDSDDPEAMAAYIDAADRYFRELEEPQRLFGKPFVPLEHAGYNVARLGYLLHHLDHHRPHTVLDFGAGMCWLTAVLLRTGGRVIALDVSATALALGAEAVQRANLPPEAQKVRFLTYDGFRIPLEDGSIDRVACFDALHHVPNKGTVLRELFRVLRHGGRACFVEPGPGHAVSAEAAEEARAWGVLEDEVDAPALCAMAEQVGFASSYVVPLPTLADHNLSAAAFEQLRHGARHDVLSWTGNDALIVLDKLADGPRDSRSPGALAAAIEVLSCPDVVSPGAVFSVALRITNIGDTLWLALPPTVSEARLDYARAFLDQPDAGDRANTDASVALYRRYIEQHEFEGRVAVGAQLCALAGGVIDIDHARGFFDADVRPGSSAQVTMQLRAPRDGGLYRLRFDLVAEYLTWFADRGSSPAHRYVTVGGASAEPDSRGPGRLAAAIRLVDRPAEGVLVLSLENTGDAIWLAHPLADGGWVRLGVQAMGSLGAVIDRDWRRVDLPRDVRPGDVVSVRLDLRAAPPEVTAVRLDLVSELRSWFADQGSPTLTWPLQARTS